MRRAALARPEPRGSRCWPGRELTPRGAGQAGSLTDRGAGQAGASRLAALVGAKPYGFRAGIFFSPLTTALKSAPARNFGTDDLGTRMGAPVAGLRAVRAGRTAFSNTPKPVMATLSPLATVDWIVSRSAFTASVAVFLPPSRPEIASIRSCLFMKSLLRFPHGRSRGRCHEFATSDLQEIRRSRAARQIPACKTPACR